MCCTNISTLKLDSFIWYHVKVMKRILFGRHYSSANTKARCNTHPNTNTGVRVTPWLEFQIINSLIIVYFGYTTSLHGHSFLTTNINIIVKPFFKNLYQISTCLNKTFSYNRWAVKWGFGRWTPTGGITSHNLLFLDQNYLLFPKIMVVETEIVHVML